MKTYPAHQSSIGEVAANLISVLCYVCLLLFWSFGAVLPLVIFLCEKKSGLVRFHAMQALLLWLLRFVLGGDLPFEGLATLMTGNVSYLMDPLGWAGSLMVIIVRLAIAAVVVVFTVAAGVNAYYWREWKVPLLGQLALLICKKSRAVAYNGEGAVPPDCAVGARAKAVPPLAAGRPRPANGGNGSPAALHQTMELPPLVMSGETAAPEPDKPPELLGPQALPEAETAKKPKRARRSGRGAVGLAIKSKQPPPLPMDDPNRSLPPDMRDPPPPDMF